ncbi:hypothetical protein [Ponticaulis sp.]|uniref:hypothetical protein n=1 Tax=Ponticaulis sp. TaxID=2020902 RepID=UPI000B6B617A|nr:hypothetical protein [Ponticaulis sp.]MAI89595.1 hypothetical protein [Ponticaulis sp.]OUY00621.1 MAG: hypothetical protein CBB65_04080 [Hyphomonadaceae bacterium TMED5]|tara:strand:+ start:11882 stop:12094 length:213 start_codon:yes stop_codon:yes gene_type:complete
MRVHAVLSIGILMLVIFAYRAANALLEPGLGVRELYILGGLIIAGWMTYSGSSELIMRRRLAKIEARETH